LKRSLKKIKRYEGVIYECRKCVYDINGNCKYRETDKGVNADLSAGIPCRLGRSKEIHGAGEPCDYRGDNTVWEKVKNLFGVMIDCIAIFKTKKNEHDFIDIHIFFVYKGINCS
jgi:hypothetical protein